MCVCVCVCVCVCNEANVTLTGVTSASAITRCTSSNPVRTSAPSEASDEPPPRWERSGVSTTWWVRVGVKSLPPARPRVCVPGHTSVAPLCSVKSSRAHIVLTITSWCGRGIGYLPSSLCGIYMFEYEKCSTQCETFKLDPTRI